MAIKQHADPFEAFSIYGGHAMAATDAKDSVTEALRAYAIEDAEQVLSIAALPDARQHLADIVKAAGGDLDKLVEKLEASLPERTVMMAESAPDVPLALGAMEPTPEVSAMIEAMMAPASAMEMVPVGAPTSVNHAASMSPIRNQGQRGTCVAFTMSAMHEFYRRKAGSAQDYSEQFLYHQIKLMDGAPTACGTWQVKGAQVLNQIGQAREAIWPYNPALPCNNNGTQPGNAMADAAQHKLPTIVLNPKNVGAIKAALAGGSVVGISVPCYNSWLNSNATRTTGRITMRLGTEPVNGGHAMCAIGYQDDAGSPGGGFFILRNSWGTTWGASCPYGAGNGTIPYQYIANDGWEAVTTPTPPSPPRPWIRPFPDPRDWRIPRPQPFPPFPIPPRPLFQAEDGQDEQATASRPAIIIDTGGLYDIIIK